MMKVTILSFLFWIAVMRRSSGFTVLPLLQTCRPRSFFSPKLHRNYRSSQFHCPSIRYVSTDESMVQETTQSDKDDDESWYTSHIAVIRSYNLAGTINGDGKGEKEIIILFGDKPNLVAVTGETGSGKSLLVAKVASLLTGASSKTIMDGGVSNGHGDAMAEIELKLSEPHISMVQRSLTWIGLDPNTVFATKTLTLRRELGMDRKSTCFINGHAVSLQALRTVASPLLAIVDASAAAAALTRLASRMAILDTAVPDPVLSYARLTKLDYRKCRRYRQRLEKELSNRMLPVSISNNDDKNIELLQHWVEELDAFESRMMKFCANVGTYATLTGARLGSTIEDISSCAWLDDGSSSDEGDEEYEAFSSKLYSNIVDFRDAIKDLEKQLDAAQRARDALASLSSPESAIAAIERTRNYLIDSTRNEQSDSEVYAASEKTHDMLNTVEEALTACRSSFDDDRTGLVSILENARASVDISIDDIDIVLADWNTLARKHGMSPFALPACHKALRAELDGNVEALTLLPEVLAREEDSLSKFRSACTMLTSARRKVARRLSLAVSQRLPSLGMGGSEFVVDLHAASVECTDTSAYSSNARILGIDSVDFLLLHGTTNGHSTNTAKAIAGANRDDGGRVESVASAGEKARLLLAIECELPGSIGAANRVSSVLDLDEAPIRLENDQDIPPPVAVIYDEIDAHVGGRAAVAMANMLANQSRQRPGSCIKVQVVSITHSPSVAAIADMHILIQRQRKGRGEQVPVRASVIDGGDRRKELARMASGDMAPDEAEAFADALLRDGANRRETMQ